MKQYNLGRMILIGLAFWVAGVVFIRYGYDIFFAIASAATAWLYVGSLVAAWISAWLFDLISGLPPERQAAGASLATWTALTLDGIALAFAPHLYSPNGGSVAIGAAWLLFAAAAILFAVVWRNRN